MRLKYHIICKCGKPKKSLTIWQQLWCKKSAQPTVGRSWESHQATAAHLSSSSESSRPRCADWDVWMILKDDAWCYPWWLSYIVSSLFFTSTIGLLELANWRDCAGLYASREEVMLRILEDLTSYQFGMDCSLVMIKFSSLCRCFEGRAGGSWDEIFFASNNDIAWSVSLETQELCLLWIQRWHRWAALLCSCPPRPLAQCVLSSRGTLQMISNDFFLRFSNKAFKLRKFTNSSWNRRTMPWLCALFRASSWW